MKSLSRRDFLGTAGSTAVSFSVLRDAFAQKGAATDELAFSSAINLARLIQQRQISSAELTEYFIGRIEQFDEDVNAVVVQGFEGAMDAARVADDSLARGNLLGPLHGVPMTIKEAFDVAAMPTTWGVPEQRNNLAVADAAVVARLKAAGAHLLGKTNVPLRLADWQSYNDIYGTTNNPWNTNRSPGGSSGGSAAALAAGLTGLEFGSDIGGSIRNPSHFCGVYGHKPTYGIVPTLGHNPLGVDSAPDLNVAGPMGRSAEDLELALDVVAGPDRFRSPGWTLTLPPPRVRALQDLRVAIWPAEDSIPTAGEISNRVQEVGEVLARAGATVSDRARPAFSPRDSHNTYLSLLGSSGLTNLPDDYYAMTQGWEAELDKDDETPLAVLTRARVMDHRSWSDHNDARTGLRLDWHSFFEDWDVMICPVSATAAFEHDHRPKLERTLTVDGAQTTHYEHYFWVGLATVAYLPSTVIPTGLSDDGLPIGLQIIGPEYGDRTTIEVAKLIARDLGGFQAPPGFS